jgi:hypothetical protein
MKKMSKKNVTFFKTRSEILTHPDRATQLIANPENSSTKPWASNFGTFQRFKDSRIRARWLYWPHMARFLRIYSGEGQDRQLWVPKESIPFGLFSKIRSSNLSPIIYGNFDVIKDNF